MSLGVIARNAGTAAIGSTMTNSELTASSDVFEQVHIEQGAKMASVMP